MDGFSVHGTIHIVNCESVRILVLYKVENIQVYISIQSLADKADTDFHVAHRLVNVSMVVLIHNLNIENP